MSKEYATPFPLLHAVSLLNHKTRLEKFSTAIRKYVDPESVVVDIGTGSGVLAIIAAAAGAKKVYAVEINKQALEYARRAAEMNGLAERIEFVQSHYIDFIPNERADIVICEMLSSMLLVEQQVPACVHARKHILKQDGTMLPSSTSVYLVPVEYDSISDRFSFGDIAFPRVPQSVSRGKARDLADLTRIAFFNHYSENLDRVDCDVSFDIVSNGTVDGFLGMFESDLDDEHKLQMDDGWRELFLPVKKPIKVQKGVNLDIHLEYTPGEYDSLSIDFL